MPKGLKRTAATICVALALGATVTTAVAFGEGDGPDAQLEELTVELKKLDVADKSNVATAELGRAEALRDKARSLIGDKKAKEQLTWALDELEATVALVDAKIEKDAAEKALADAKAAVDAKQQEISSLTTETETLEKKQGALEKKLGGGK
jgi:chromosome segregation ATPase